MSEKTIIIGHKNPDTDSICSAICYADLKTQMGRKEIIAGRAGTINPQTEFVLSRFNQPPPKYFSDIYPRLSDIMVKKPASVDSQMPVLSAMKIFKEKGIRFLPVTNENNTVVGTLSPIELTKEFISYIDPAKARSVMTSPHHIKIATNAAVVTGIQESLKKDYCLFVGAMSAESFQKAIKGYNPTQLIIVVGDRMDIVDRSIENKAAVVLLTGKPKINASIIRKAKKKGVCLLSTPYDSQTAAWLVKMSTPSEHFSIKEFFPLLPNERVEMAKNEFVKSQRRGIVVTDKEKRLEGVVTKSDFLKKHSLSLILVDHNELSQAIDGADQANIIEVVDHHRLAAFQTALPITITIEPVGSTCTLITEMFIKKKADLEKRTAGLLLSGIISDTVTGRSPTTTDRDRDSMDLLENILTINKEKYAAQMFDASSIVGERSPREVLLNDFKEFLIGGKKIGIGQVEVVGFNRFFQEKRGLQDAIRQYKDKNNFDMIGLMVTDITYETTLLPVDADPEITEALSFPLREKNIFELKGVLSRKKQVIPHLFNVLK